MMINYVLNINIDNVCHNVNKIFLNMNISSKHNIINQAFILSKSDLKCDKFNKVVDKIYNLLLNKNELFLYYEDVFSKDDDFSKLTHEMIINEEWFGLMIGIMCNEFVLSE